MSSPLLFDSRSKSRWKACFQHLLANDDNCKRIKTRDAQNEANVRAEKKFYFWRKTKLLPLIQSSFKISLKNKYIYTFEAITDTVKTFGSLSKNTVNWPFLRTLSKTRNYAKNAQFCQVHFSHRTFFWCEVSISTYTQFSIKRQNVCYGAFFCCFLRISRDRNQGPLYYYDLTRLR